MTEEMAQLEVRLQKALEQQKESMVKNNRKYRVIILYYVPRVYGIPGKHLNNSF